jgi:hypothetical protein
MACLANPTAGSLPCATLFTYRDDLRRASIGPMEDCIHEGVKTGTTIGEDRPACPGATPPARELALRYPTRFSCIPTRANTIPATKCPARQSSGDP